jgi:serine/threonine protein kinase
VQSQLVDQKELRSELEACLEERSELQSEVTELRLQFPCGTGLLGMADVMQDDACSEASPVNAHQRNSFSVSSPNLQGTCSNSSVPRELLLDEICLEGETLGNGAVGTVCRAQLMVDGQDRTVAVKQFGADTDAFLMERKYLARIRHPNIVEVLGQLTLEEGPCLVLELLRKPEWHALQPAKALCDMLQGVAYIHECQTVHLDIKIDNIMQGCDVDASAPLKLIDFSIAASSEQSCHGFMGSLPFAAPEVLSDSPWWGAPADIFSVGVILVFILELKLLFHHLGFAKDIKVDDRNERRHELPKLRKAWDSLAAELPPGDGQDLCRNLLNLTPEARLTATDALRCCSPWLSEA